MTEGWSEVSILACLECPCVLGPYLGPRVVLRSYSRVVDRELDVRMLTGVKRRVADTDFLDREVEDVSSPI